MVGVGGGGLNALPTVVASFRLRLVGRAEGKRRISVMKPASQRKSKKGQGLPQKKFMVLLQCVAKKKHYITR